MKRFLSVICITALLLGILCAAAPAWAEVSSTGVKLDFSTATDQDLEDAIRAIQEEQRSRSAKKGGGTNQDARGQTFTNRDGVSLTVLSVKQTRGASYAEADPGKTFVIVEMQIENNTSAPISINSTFGFEAMCDDYRVDYSFTADLATENDFPLSDLKVGRKVKGCKGFEVPQDWKEMIITFTPDVSIIGGGDPIEFFIYNK